MKYVGKANRAAIKLLLFSLLVLLGLFAFAYAAVQLGHFITYFYKVLIALWVLFAIFVAYFFRDPDPIEPSDPKAIVSPAHGKVDVLEEAIESEFMKGPCHRISISLSLFDVHVQNAPVSGRVELLRYSRGSFRNAMRSESGLHNENVLVGIESLGQPAHRVGVRQIAGFLARRIVRFVAPDQVVTRGQRIGLIQFGSRVDLYLPKQVKLKVNIGDRVVGGQSVVAVFE